MAVAVAFQVVVVVAFQVAVAVAFLVVVAVVVEVVALAVAGRSPAGVVPAGASLSLHIGTLRMRTCRRRGWRPCTRCRRRCRRCHRRRPAAATACPVLRSALAWAALGAGRAALPRVTDMGTGWKGVAYRACARQPPRRCVGGWRALDVRTPVALTRDHRLVPPSHVSRTHRASPGTVHTWQCDSCCGSLLFCF